MKNTKLHIAFIAALLLFISWSAVANGGLRLVEDTGKAREFVEEIKLEFNFSDAAPKTQYFVLTNTGTRPIRVRLAEGSKMGNAEFSMSGIPEGTFALGPGEEKRGKMRFKPGSTPFTSWETNFETVGVSREKVRIKCIGRRNLVIDAGKDEKAYWELVRSKHTKEAYDAFLKRFPNSKLTEEAERRIKAFDLNPEQGKLGKINPVTQADLNQAVQRNDEEALEDILEKHRGSPDEEEIKLHVEAIKDRKAFEDALEIGSKEAYQNYLNNFPDGKYQLTVKEKLGQPMPEIPEEAKPIVSELIGQLMYFIKDTMEAGQTYPVEMTIQPKLGGLIEVESGENEIVILDPNSNTTTTIIPVASKMKAQLIDTSPEQKFHIVQFGSSEKSVDLSEGGFTLWQWNVVPLEHGMHFLNFLVEVIIETEEESITSAVPVYRKEVRVVAETNFLSKYGAYLYGGIGAAFLALLVLFFGRAKKNSPTTLMEQSGAIPKLSDRIVFLVKHNQPDLALKELDRFLEDKDEALYQDVVLLKSRLTALREDQRKGIADYNTSKKERAQINIFILEIANQLEEDFNV